MKIFHRKTHSIFKNQQPYHANAGYCDAIDFVEIEDSTQYMLSISTQSISH